MRTFAPFLLGLALTSIAAGQPSMKTVTEEYPDRFSVDVAFPRFYDKTPVAEAASKAIGDWASKQQNDFTASALKQTRDLGVPSEPYELKIASEVTFFSPKKLISVTCDGYNFLGGAHGITSYQVFNLADIRGKAKQLTLADLFKRGSSYKSRISSLILGKLKEDESATLIQSGEVKTLTEAQLNRFQVHPDGITFLFEAGELAPYSDGRFKVELSMEELGPDFEWGKTLSE